MSNPQIERLKDKERASISTVDDAGPIKKQVVATSGKLRVAVLKDNKDGKTNN